MSLSFVTSFVFVEDFSRNNKVPTSTLYFGNAELLYKRPFPKSVGSETRHSVTLVHSRVGIYVYAWLTCVSDGRVCKMLSKSSYTQNVESEVVCLKGEFTNFHQGSCIFI